MASLAQRRARNVETLDTRTAWDLPLVDNHAPDEFCVFKAGLNPSTKGTFLFDDKAQKLVMDAYASRGVPMMMDYEHQSQYEPPIVAPASAQECTPEIRDGALWLKGIKWTANAKAFLESGEYRLFSPAFTYQKLSDGTMRVTSLINVALTNNPALHNIEPLTPAMAASAKEKDNEMDELEKANAALKASREECAALSKKLSEMDEKLTALSAKKKGEEEEEMKATAALRSEIATITGKADHREQVGVLRSIKLRADEGAAAVEKLAVVEEQSREAELTAILKTATDEGKLVKATREKWDQRCRDSKGKVTVEGLAMLKDFAPTFPVVVNREPARTKDGKRIASTSEEATVLLKFGINAEESEAFEKFRAGTLGAE